MLKVLSLFLCVVLAYTTDTYNLTSDGTQDYSSVNDNDTILISIIIIFAMGLFIAAGFVVALWFILIKRFPCD